MLSRFTEMPEKADTSFGVPGVAGVGREQKKAPEPEVNLAEIAEILAKMTSVRLAFYSSRVLREAEDRTASSRH